MTLHLEIIIGIIVIIIIRARFERKAVTSLYFHHYYCCGLKDCDLRFNGTRDKKESLRSPYFVIVSQNEGNYKLINFDKSPIIGVYECLLLLSDFKICIVYNLLEI
ncbi:hypothetical protein ACJX0J_023720, partial [Zea mays]